MGSDLSKQGVPIRIGARAHFPDSLRENSSPRREWGGNSFFANLSFEAGGEETDVEIIASVTFRDQKLIKCR